MQFARRMKNIPKSFVREILKVTENKNIISFAGGLPNPNFFPIEEIKKSSVNVLEKKGSSCLQYGITEGYMPLREYIVNRYYKDLDITPDNILITNGSQQALDLIGKVFLDIGDEIVIEKPGYLGAIQSFSTYEPNFNVVELKEDGIDLDKLEETFKNKNPQLFYAVTNFQNPSGLSYSLDNRKKLVELLKKYNVLMIDDNPYMELNFIDKKMDSMISLQKDNIIALGSFSKIFAPSMRIGWVCANHEIIEQLNIVKQASDLHTNMFSQMILEDYLSNNDLDNHIIKISEYYKEQKDFMLSCLDNEKIEYINYTRPEGGMFIWVTLPENMSSAELFEYTINRGTTFVPGNPFYLKAKDTNTLRLNYTNSSKEDIEKGIKVLGDGIRYLYSKIN